MSIPDISAEVWDREVLKVDKPVIVDFWHENCGYCLKLNPILEDLAGDLEEVKLVKLNVTESRENTEIARRYGIMGTPTLKFFCEGRVIGEIVGFRPAEVLKEKIREVVESAEDCIEKSTKLAES